MWVKGMGWKNRWHNKEKQTGTTVGKRHGRRKMKILFGCGKKTRKLFEKTRKMAVYNRREAKSHFGINKDGIQAAKDVI